MAGYTVWKNTATNVYYRVGEDAQSKIPISGTVLSVDLYFVSNAVIPADTSDLRAWLNSIPNA